MDKNDNRIFCIARYDEDINWIKVNMKGNIIIYNKSKSWPYEFPAHDVPNFGRETETFIRFIIQYYNQLDSFDSVVFLQGNPFDHCNNILHRLNNINHTSFELLSDKTLTNTFPKTDYYKIHLSTMCKLFGKEHDWNLDSFMSLENDSNELLSGIRHLENCIALCYSLGIETKGVTYDWAPGCQYQIPVHMIKTKSLQWWLDIHNMHSYLSGVRKFDFLGYTLETVWPLLFTHVEKR